jgi:hypothetical protein
MIEKKGQANINQFNNNSDINSILEKLRELEMKIIIGRVTDIILNENHPLFSKSGKWNSIGTVICEIPNFQTSNTINAKPFFPQSPSYPLLDELVLLIPMSNILLGNNDGSKSYYYINMINLWNNPHLNTFPNLISKSNLKTTINPSQNTFTEKSNIRPLLSFAGDIIYQGRFSNSIRFSSTSKPLNSPPLNNWSQNGENGNPIIIIRNGQNPKIENNGFIPITEDVNEDLSSIYITSNQQIPINVASINYNSYFTPPISPNQYTSSQIIITSDRLIFNAKKDHILLSAENSIGLSTNNSININTKNLLIDAGQIKLGNKNALESVIKGDTLYKNLDLLITSLLQVVQILKYSQKWPGGAPVPDAEMSVAASSAETILKNIQSNLENILSKNVKTI